MQSNYSLHCDNCFQQTKYGGSTFSTKVEVVEIDNCGARLLQSSNCYKFHFNKIEYSNIIIAIRFEDWKIIKYDKFIKKRKLILFE